MKCAECGFKIDSVYYAIGVKRLCKQCAKAIMGEDVEDFEVLR